LSHHRILKPNESRFDRVFWAFHRDSASKAEMTSQIVHKDTDKTWWKEIIHETSKLEIKLDPVEKFAHSQPKSTQKLLSNPKPGKQHG
jgi:hypothetical protein